MQYSCRNHYSGGFREGSQDAGVPLFLTWNYGSQWATLYMKTCKKVQLLIFVNPLLKILDLPMGYGIEIQWIQQLHDILFSTILY